MSTFSELIDFTRSSTGTYLDSVVYGDELVTNGTFDTDSGWTLGTNASISGGTLSYSGGSGNVSSYQNIGLEANKTYHITATVSGYVQGHLSFRAGGNLTDTPDITANGTYSFVFTVPSNGNFNFMIDASTTFVGTIDNVSVKEIIGGQGTAGTPLLRTADTNEPRLEYDASGQPLGLLIEEQRTNLVSNSSFSSAWSGGGYIKTANATIAPDGTNTATKIAWDNTTSYHSIFNTYSVSAQTAYTRSVYAKASELSWIYVQHYDSGGGANNNGGVYFDVANGVKGTESSGHTGIIEDIGNGWYRCSVAYTTSTGTTTERLQVALTTGDNVFPNNLTGDGVSGVFLWGAQLEAGAFPTSYIPTSGSTVTRNKDVCDTPVERFGYSNTKGSIVVYAQSNKPDVGVYAFELAVNSSDRMFSKFYDREHLRVRVSSADTAILDVGNIETGSFAKLGARFATNDFAISKDGNTPVTDTNGDVNLNSSELKIGQSYANNAHLNGHIKRIQYFPKRLSNDELVELTKPSSSPTMSLTFDGQATSELVEGLHD